MLVVYSFMLSVSQHEKIACRKLKCFSILGNVITDFQQGYHLNVGNPGNWMFLLIQQKQNVNFQQVLGKGIKQLRIVKPVSKFQSYLLSCFNDQESYMVSVRMCWSGIKIKHGGLLAAKLMVFVFTLFFFFFKVKQQNYNE